jgi:hypothetical protein
VTTNGTICVCRAVYGGPTPCLRPELRRRTEPPAKAAIGSFTEVDVRNEVAPLFAVAASSGSMPSITTPAIDAAVPTGV